MTAVILTAILAATAAPPADGGFQDAEVLREAVRQAAADSRSHDHATLLRAAEQLLQLHAAVTETELLPRLERIRLERSLRARLEHVSERIARRLASQEEQGQSLASPPPQAAGGAANRDQGQQLLELIQQVIFPDRWDVAGGDSRGVYFQNRQVLVIRAPSEVHNGVADLLIQLRRN